jgi:toxin ParE1/3/4
MTRKPAKFEILITQDAEDDLEQIHDFLAIHYDLKQANNALDEIYKAATTLATFPNRGSYPKELLALGILEFRQLVHKRFRIIYRVIGHQVSINLIADGRQDMQTLLTRRILSTHVNPFH